MVLHLLASSLTWSNDLVRYEGRPRMLVAHHLASYPVPNFHWINCMLTINTWYCFGFSLGTRHWYSVTGLDLAWTQFHEGRVVVNLHCGVHIQWSIALLSSLLHSGIRHWRIDQHSFLRAPMDCLLSSLLHSGIRHWHFVSSALTYRRCLSLTGELYRGLCK